ncbi:hypothetical protein TNIN_223541 [Trichonephila inaurata madagascariensis]|uniref:Uncharacterized protein n=1 Tax=Trichonephila inaurata madagascariensis TaxID=2747483 RepID=A0A8X6JQ07_9ARAC|nr:hypothetical protein TNIN_223541 [Trichonephila inaurata madagascariensis]
MSSESEATEDDCFGVKSYGQELRNKGLALNWMFPRRKISLQLSLEHTRSLEKKPHEFRSQRMQLRDKMKTSH